MDPDPNQDSDYIPSETNRQCNHAQSARILAIRKQRIAEGTMPFAPRPPLGIDRLYVAQDGQELYIVRDMPGGGSVQLNPTTGEVQRSFAAGAGYRKRADERIMYVPGATDLVEAIRFIFQKKFVEEWTAPRIAQVLNDEGCKSGGKRNWIQSTIQQALRNPFYIGIGVANRSSESPYDPAVVGMARLRRQKFKIVYRPSSEWMIHEYPRLKYAFVPENLYERVKQFQFDLLTRNADWEGVE
jgi:hypothetical protein